MGQHRHSFGAGDVCLIVLLFQGPALLSDDSAGLPISRVVL